MVRWIGIAIITVGAFPVLALQRTDSLWVHINSMSEQKEGKRWKAVTVAWQVSVKEYDNQSEMYGDWRAADEFDSLELNFIVQCAWDSTFEKLASSETTDAKSYVLSGIPQKSVYFIRVVPTVPLNPFRSDFAMGGTFEKNSKFGEEKKYFIIVLVSVLMIISGMSTIIFVFLYERRKRKTAGTF